MSNKAQNMYPDLVQYYDYQATIENLLNRVGLWPHREDIVSWCRFSTIYGLFVLSVINIKILVYGITHANNITVIINCLRVWIVLFVPMMRMVCCFIYRKELTFLDKGLGRKFNEQLRNDKYRPALLKKMPLYHVFMQLYLISSILAAVLYCIPYAIVIFKYKKSVQLYMGKYPFPVEPRSSLYWTIFTFELSSFWYIINALSGVDNTFGLHCFRIGGFLRLASQLFVNDLNPDDPNFRNQLKECVKIHQLVIRAKLALEKSYGFIIIWNYIFSAIVMCSLLWQLDQMKSHITPMKLFLVIFYMATKVIQCFIYAYYGSSVTTESEKYRDAVYMSNWLGSGNVRLMKDIHLILTQRTVILKACGYFLITMQFFEKICQTSISYFFLIQSIDLKH